MPPQDLKAMRVRHNDVCGDQYVSVSDISVVRRVKGSEGIGYEYRCPRCEALIGARAVASVLEALDRNGVPTILKNELEGEPPAIQRLGADDAHDELAHTMRVIELVQKLKFPDKPRA